MGSPSHRNSTLLQAQRGPAPWPRSPLPQPSDDPRLLRTFAGYRRSLQRMTIEQLQEHLTAINGQLQAEQAVRLASMISATASGSPTNLDSPVVRSPRTELPRSDPRGAAASSPAPTPRLSPLDRLAQSQYLAPRIAAKLVLSEVRRASRERE